MPIDVVPNPTAVVPNPTAVVPIPVVVPIPTISTTELLGKYAISSFLTRIVVFGG